MVRYAAKVDKNQASIVRCLRQAGCRVRDTSAVGQGFPDLIVYRPSTGQLFLLECKDGDLPPSQGRNRLSEQQLDFHAEWPVAVVCDIEEAFAAVGIPIKPNPGTGPGLDR